MVFVGAGSTVSLAATVPAGFHLNLPTLAVGSFGSLNSVLFSAASVTHGVG